MPSASRLVMSTRTSAVSRELDRQIGGSVDEVLAVVEDQHQRAAECLDDPFGVGPPERVGRAERGEDGYRNGIDPLCG
jgi:hypothetical protein